MRSGSATAIQSGLGVLAACLLAATAPTVRAEARYRVAGDKVDKATFGGGKIYKRQRCETCHGPRRPRFSQSAQQLKESLERTIPADGPRGPEEYAGLQGYKAVVDNLEGLYAYLKGRSDGAIPSGDSTEMR